jgi:predicted metal-dependent hydrolase
VDSEIKYSVIFSRRRSISLVVSPHKGVIVRAPYRTSIRSIEKFVEEKSVWIRKHLNNYSTLTRLNHPVIYSGGERLFFMGKEHYLKLTESPEPFIKRYDNIIEIGIKDTGNHARIRAMLDRYYRQMADDYLKSRFVQIIERYAGMGFFPTGFIVKPLKSRWGSCSSHGRITISSELIKLDPVYSDYVIIHEICHLKHHNHGKEFYSLLESMAPGYKVIRKELGKYLTR